MKGVRVAVHQSSNVSERRKLFSITASPSVTVVSEIAPRWITPSSLRPSSHRGRSPGDTMSAIWRFCKLRHLPSWPSQSLTATARRPASLRLATTFDPMKPAPPVTSSMDCPEACLPLPHSVRRRNQARDLERTCLAKYLMLALSHERANIETNLYSCL